MFHKTVLKADVNDSPLIKKNTH